MLRSWIIAELSLFEFDPVASCLFGASFLLVLLVTLELPLTCSAENAFTIDAICCLLLITFDVTMKTLKWWKNKIWQYFFGMTKLVRSGNKC